MGISWKSALRPIRDWTIAVTRWEHKGYHSCIRAFFSGRTFLCKTANQIHTQPVVNNRKEVIQCLIVLSRGGRNSGSGLLFVRSFAPRERRLVTRTGRGHDNGKAVPRGGLSCFGGAQCRISVNAVFMCGFALSYSGAKQFFLHTALILKGHFHEGPSLHRARRRHRHDIGSSRSHAHHTSRQHSKGGHHPSRRRLRSGHDPGATWQMPPAIHLSPWLPSRPTGPALLSQQAVRLKTGRRAPSGWRRLCRATPTLQTVFECHCELGEQMGARRKTAERAFVKVLTLIAKSGLQSIA